MAVDHTIVTALAAAIEGDPNNQALRLHLADLLNQSGRPEEALVHIKAVLHLQPDNTDALRLGAQAARNHGDATLASSYERLFAALSARSSKNLLDSFANEPSNTEYNLNDSDEKPFDDDPEERVLLRLYAEDEGDSSQWDVEKPAITLNDVAGMQAVKRRLNTAFLAPMRNPEMTKMYGKSLRGGLLLYGPPGCGKTMIARATAGELGAKFMSVGITDVIDMYHGESEKHLAEIFESARRNRPCVLFFDEIDALGRKRSLIRGQGGRDTVNQLLAEMDNVRADNEGLFVLAATNHPWDVDVALRRPGRFDRTLLVLPPDSEARESIVRNQMRDRPIELIDFAWIATRTDGYSGADIAHLCESATEFALEESLAKGTPRPVRQSDFVRALKEVKPSMTPWFDTARNYALFANEGGMYDDLLKYLRSVKMG